MAGHRRTRKPGTKTLRARHYDNAKALLIDRLADTADPGERLGHVYAYALGALRRAQRRNPHHDISVFDAALRTLTTAGDVLIR